MGEGEGKEGLCKSCISTPGIASASYSGHGGNSGCCKCFPQLIKNMVSCFQCGSEQDILKYYHFNPNNFYIKKRSIQFSHFLLNTVSNQVLHGHFPNISRTVNHYN